MYAFYDYDQVKRTLWFGIYSYFKASAFTTVKRDAKIQIRLVKGEPLLFVEYPR